MEFGINFFPSVGPSEKSAAQYWEEALRITEISEGLGFSHIRTVEHYFHPYGGYSPNPAVFLAAAAQRTKTARLVTGAVLPVFNNPLKLAGELAMLDALSNGRVDIGFARAFLPHEFERFGISLDESRVRFSEGLEQVKRLLEEENVTMEGQFHSFRDVTSLPRPTQTPRPPIWVAVTATPESFETAGKNGYFIMCIPLYASKLRDLIALYRDARRAAGHSGNGKVMMSHAMYTARTTDEAIRKFRDPLNSYLGALVDGASGWLSGSSSADYPGYEKMIAAIKSDNFDLQRKAGIAWVGTPSQVTEMIADFSSQVGGFDIASLQVNPHMTTLADAEASMQLFAAEVMPSFTARFGT